MDECCLALCLSRRQIIHCLVISSLTTFRELIKQVESAAYWTLRQETFIQPHWLNNIMNVGCYLRETAICHTCNFELHCVYWHRVCSDLSQGNQLFCNQITDKQVLWTVARKFGFLQVIRNEGAFYHEPFQITSVQDFSAFWLHNAIKTILCSQYNSTCFFEGLAVKLYSCVFLVALAGTHARTQQQHKVKLKVSLMCC